MGQVRRGVERTAVFRMDSDIQPVISSIPFHYLCESEIEAEN